MPSIRDSRPTLEVAAHLQHAKSAKFKVRLDEAVDIIERGLKLAPDAYVACSFGKDSAVLLHLVLAINPDVSVRFLRWQESNLLSNYDEVIAAWSLRNLAVVDMVRANLDERVVNRWDSLVMAGPTSGYLIGLRAEESKARRMTLAQHGAIYQRKDGLWRISPLAVWRTEDVAAYALLHDVPMLKQYHEHGFDERTSSRVPRAVVRGEMLSQMRQRYPDEFEALATQFPEVREWV